MTGPLFSWCCVSDHQHHYYYYDQNQLSGGESSVISLVLGVTSTTSTTSTTIRHISRLCYTWLGGRWFGRGERMTLDKIWWGEAWDWGETKVLMFSIWVAAVVTRLDHCDQYWEWHVWSSVVRCEHTEQPSLYSGERPTVSQLRAVTGATVRAACCVISSPHCRVMQAPGLQLLTTCSGLSQSSHMDIWQRGGVREWESDIQLSSVSCLYLSK